MASQDNNVMNRSKDQRKANLLRIAKNSLSELYRRIDEVRRLVKMHIIETDDIKFRDSEDRLYIVDYDIFQATIDKISADLRSSGNDVNIWVDEMYDEELKNVLRTINDNDLIVRELDWLFRNMYDYDYEEILPLIENTLKVLLHYSRLLQDSVDIGLGEYEEMDMRDRIYYDIERERILKYTRKVIDNPNLIERLEE